MASLSKTKSFSNIVAKPGFNTQPLGAFKAFSNTPLFAAGNFIPFCLLFSALGLLLLMECLLNLTPPISRDGMIHHLAIPKLWLRHGGFYEIPWA
ncbi:MAG: hypothetical protein KKB94_01180, partial [Proteobacteria bacterium]|nr:hypothetical protein [Pseudomonadota bacterium]